MLNSTMAKSTKYATLARRGWAVLREFRMAVVPAVMVRRRAVRSAARARKTRMWVLPDSTPKIARAKEVQKARMAMASMRDQLWRRYGA
jgi:G:T/U-mismatch repair DNA glycosylase